MKIIIDCAIGRIKPTNAEPTEEATKFGCEACEYIHNNIMHRCSKFVYLAGENPQDGNKIVNEGKCIDVWQPLLQIEVSNASRLQTHAMESFRNVTVSQQENFVNVVRALDNEKLGLK